jgi:hypothetical protein
MSWGAILAAIGGRGLIAALVAAVVAAAPAYHAGRWVEAAAAEERLARVLAEHAAARLEAENERIGKAFEARRRAGGDTSGGGNDGSGLPDDGFRRD